MSRKITLQHSQQIPTDWETEVASANIPSEDDLIRADWMSDDFYDGYRANFSTKALVYSSMHALETTAVPAITLAGEGSWNRVFLIQFPDDSKVAARIAKKSARFPGRIESTVATMTLARYYHHIPVPNVYAWHGSEENAVGAPYTLQEWVEGIGPWEKWYDLDIDGRTAMLDELAKYHAMFAAPLPFQGLGSIFFADRVKKDSIDSDLSDVSAYRVGSLIPGPSCTEYRDAPIQSGTAPTSLIDFWMHLWQSEVDFIVGTHGRDRSIVMVTEDHPSYSIQTSYTLGQFLDAADDLLKVIKHCSLPLQPELHQICLVTTDYAFRNIKLNPETLRVSSFLDWDDVSAMPFLLCTRFPEDICCTARVDESWFRGGGFNFLPLDEEGPMELLKQDIESEDKLEEETEDEDGDEDEDDGGPSSPLPVEVSEASVDSEQIHKDTASPPSISSDEEEFQELDRRQRIEDTHFRRRYIELLTKHDPRYSTDELWQIREDPLKIQYLVTHGWIAWLSKAEWLRGRANELKGQNRCS